MLGIQTYAIGINLRRGCLCHASCVLVLTVFEVNVESDFDVITTFFGVSLQYRPIVDLFERLDELARLAARYVDEFPSVPTCLDQQITHSALQYLRKKGLRRQGIGRGGNPATGLLEKSSLASAVMQIPDQHCRAIYDSLCILLLVYCTEQSSSSSGDEASREIRLSARAVDPRNSLISKLPHLSSDTEGYLLAIRERLKSLENESVAKSQQKLFYVLQNLTSFDRKRASPIQRGNDFSSALIESKKVLAGDDVKLPGLISKVYEASSEPDEPPNSATVFESHADVESDPVVFEFAARKAKSWIQKSETLSRVDTTTLNELEKRLLTKQLKLQLDKEFGESAIGFAVALIYLLGLELEQVMNTRWGGIGFISLQGQWRKVLPPLPRIFRSRQNEQEPHTCFLPLPSILMKWLELHAQRLAGSDSLLAAVGETEADFSARVRQLLSLWRQNGRYRFKLAKLAAALSAEVTYQTRDPLVITTLSGDLKKEPPVLMYYRVLNEPELSQAYKTATNSLLDIPEDLFGFDGVVDAEIKISHQVTSLIEGMSARLRTQLKQHPVNIIHSHNALMYFTLTMMMFATGHRPVRDPFCWWDDFSINNDGVLISDKVISPRHEYRYQVIPELVSAQLNVFRRHLRQLGARLYRDKSLKRQQLGVSILSSLEGSSKQLPIFFEIDEAGVSHHSVTQKSLQAYWEQFSELPSNAGRSVLCQLLINNHVQAGIVELYLGHIHGLSHRHGPRAGHAPAMDFSILAKEIDRAMKQLGWKPFNPYKQNRDRVRLPKNLKRQLIKSQKITTLGPEKRWLKRLQRQNQIKEIVASARDEIIGGIVNNRLHKEQVDEFFNCIKRECHQAGLSIQNGVNLASRWLANLKRSGVSVESFRYRHTLPAESSLISRETFRGIKQCRQLQASLLSEFSKSEGTDSFHQALTELVITAAVFGGLAKTEALKTLPEQIFTDAYRLSDQNVIIEINEQRWLPDVLSLSRILYIRKHYHAEQVQTVLEGLQRHLVRYLRSLGLNCSSSNVFGKLSGLAQSLNAWKIPGALHRYFKPKQEGRHLPRHRLVTLFDDKPYLPESSDDNVVEQAMTDWLPKLRQTQSTCMTATQCWRDINSLFTEVEQSLPVGAGKRSRAHRTKLAKKLRQYAQKSDVSMTAKILIAWLVARCRHGLSKENLALSTIKRYASEIIYPLLALAGSDLRLLDEDNIEALYLECLESCVGDKAYRLGRLFDLHHFLQTHFALPTINWSALYASAGLDDVMPSVDANILTVSEYDLAIQTINDEAGLTPWIKSRYIVALILGYRFGLRFSEAFKLRVIDIQRMGNKVFLQLRGSVFGDLKTQAGVRQIPLIGSFSELESKAWEAVTVEAEYWIEREQQTLLFFDGRSPRVSIERQKAQGYLNALLKSVSNDDSLHFHHLRHSFANRLMAQAYSPPNSLWQKISRRLIGRLGSQHLPLLWSSDDEPTIKLQAIADIMGHASILTTVSSYFHFPEFLAHGVCHQDEIQLTPKIMAYLLGQSEAALQKRRERTKGNNHIQAYLTGEPIRKLIPLLRTPFQLGSLHEQWQYDFPEVSEAISLQSINRVLVQSARVRCMTSPTAILGNDQHIEIESVLKNAAMIQTKTGFNFYEVPFVDPDALGGDKEQEAAVFQENVLEAERLNVLLAGIDEKSTALSTLKDGSFPNMSKLDQVIWQVNGRAGRGWFFSRKSALSAFIELLALLPMKDASFTLVHPSGHPLLDDEVTELLYRHPALFEMTSDEKLQNGVLLKASCLPPSWKTVQTLNRVVFCLLVWLLIKQDSAAY